MIDILLDIFGPAIRQGNVVKTFIKLLFWKCNQRFLNIPMIVALKDGIKCICYPDSSYGSLVVYLSYPEPSVFRTLRAVLKPNHVFIDVGANIGLVSLVASTITRNQIYAFEADERVYPRFIENIHLNDKSKQIKPHFMAISDRSGYVSFIQETHAEVSHVSYHSRTQQNKKDNVRSMTLDGFLTEKKIHKACVVKVDVEGAELKVLKGMKQALKSKQIDALLLEINQNCRHFGHEPEDTIVWLHRVGYRVYLLETHELLVPKSKIEFHNETAINVLVLPETV